MRMLQAMHITFFSSVCNGRKPEKNVISVTAILELAVYRIHLELQHKHYIVPMHYSQSALLPVTNLN